jgi:hydrogenase maturation factor
MTKWAAIEGTAIIANEHKGLAAEILERDELKAARKLIYSVSVLPEARIAADMFVSAMHDVTEGGILGAAWEMAEAAGLGVEVFQENIPVLPVTHILCGTLDIDCYRLIGSGSLLIATDKPKELLTRLEDENIMASEIGRFTGEPMRMLIADGEPGLLHEPGPDEIYKISLT